MTDEQEFEEHRHWKQYWEKEGYKPDLTDDEQRETEIIAKYWSWKGWLEKGKRDREKILNLIEGIEEHLNENRIGSFELDGNISVVKCRGWNKLHKLLEEMK